MSLWMEIAYEICVGFWRIVSLGIRRTSLQHGKESLYLKCQLKDIVSFLKEGIIVPSNTNGRNRAYVTLVEQVSKRFIVREGMQGYRTYRGPGQHPLWHNTGEARPNPTGTDPILPSMKVDPWHPTKESYCQIEVVSSMKNIFHFV